jgi:hypothetical protein
MKCILAIVIGLAGPSVSAQNRQPIDLQKVPVGDGTVHLTQSQTQAALVRVAEAICKQAFPVDTSTAQYNCLLAMKNALSPPVKFGPCSTKPRTGRDGQECWRQDLTTNAWDWFPVTDST